MKRNKNSRITISEMLWQRRYYYIAGYIIGIIADLLCIVSGSDVDIIEMLIIPLSVSFPFGFILYNAIKEPIKFKKERRNIFFSREGLINITLAIGSCIVFGLIYQILKLL